MEIYTNRHFYLFILYIIYIDTDTKIYSSATTSWIFQKYLEGKRVCVLERESEGEKIR